MTFGPAALQIGSVSLEVAWVLALESGAYRNLLSLAVVFSLGLWNLERGDMLVYL